MLDPKIRLTTEEGEFLCFRHAVLHAVAGGGIEMEVSAEGGGNDMRSWHCKRCSAEEEGAEDDS